MTSETSMLNSEKVADERAESKVMYMMIMYGCCIPRKYTMKGEATVITCDVITIRNAPNFGKAGPNIVRTISWGRKNIIPEENKIKLLLRAVSGITSREKMLKKFELNVLWKICPKFMNTKVRKFGFFKT